MNSQHTPSKNLKVNRDVDREVEGDTDRKIDRGVVSDVDRDVDRMSWGSFDMQVNIPRCRCIYIKISR